MLTAQRELTTARHHYPTKRPYESGLEVVFPTTTARRGGSRARLAVLRVGRNFN